MKTTVANSGISRISGTPENSVSILKAELVYDIASAAYLAADAMETLTPEARTALRDIAEPESLHLLERLLDEASCEAASRLSDCHLSSDSSNSSDPSDNSLKSPERWLFRLPGPLSRETLGLLCVRIHRFMVQFALARSLKMLTGSEDRELMSEAEAAGEALASLARRIRAQLPSRASRPLLRPLSPF